MNAIKPKRKWSIRERVERKVHQEICNAYSADEVDYACRAAKNLIEFVMNQILEAENRGIAFAAKSQDGMLNPSKTEK